MDLQYPNLVPCGAVPCLAQLIGVFIRVKYQLLKHLLALLLEPLISYHSAVDSGVLTLDLEFWLGCHGVEDEVVIAVRAVLVRFLKLLDVFAEALLALLAREDHLEPLLQGVVLLLRMALNTIEPFLAYFMSITWSVHILCVSKTVAG